MLANAVSHVQPTLFLYTLDKTAREGISARKVGQTLELIRDRTHSMIRMSAGNAVHLPDMVKSFDYYFNSAESVAIRHRGAIYDLVDFSSPRLHNVNGFADFAVLCPSSTEPYATTQQYLAFAGIGPGSTVLDLGAYSALTSIAFSKEVGPTGRVIALEPDPMNYRSAEYNVAMNRRVNGLDNITLCRMAVSDTNGTIAMSSEGTMGSALVHIVGSYRGANVDVPCRTLGALADELGLEKVDFIKMDVEGAELFALPAAGDFLKSHRPRLIIECHMVGGKSTIEPLMRFLAGIGYNAEVVSQEGLAFSLIQAWP